MRMANCPRCGAPAISQKLTFAPAVSGGIRITTAPVAKVGCSGECKGVMRAETLRDATRKWNAWVAREVATNAEALGVRP